MPKKLDRKNLTHNFQKLAFKQLKILTNALKAMKNTKKNNCVLTNLPFNFKYIFSFLEAKFKAFVNFFSFEILFKWSPFR